MAQFDFTGRRVLVTGGGRGLGRAMVQAFVDYNATVIVLEREESFLAELKKDLPSVIGVQVDLGDWDRTREVVKGLLPIHHLVNNAAILDFQPLLDFDKNALDRVININLKAPYNLIQVVGRGMIDHKVENGTIVNISSMGDYSIVHGGSAYHASKAAISAISRAAAYELGTHGIRVNYVRPGHCRTTLLDSVSPEGQKKILDAVLARISLKRVIEPSEVANTVIYLSSPLSSMVTGTSITIDAGHAYG